MGLKFCLGVAALAAALTVRVEAQDRLTTGQKLTWHLRDWASPVGLAGSTALSTIAHFGVLGGPDWGRGAGAYGRRLAAYQASTGAEEVMAWGMESALRQDPRYFRAESTAFWPRLGHALAATLVIRTDAGGRAPNLALAGGRMGAALLATRWYPAGYNGIGDGVARGGFAIGTAALTNLASEFWPDLRDRIFRRHRVPASSGNAVAVRHR
ncbi:MAG: hypothetical protein M1436_09580 [Acidobacteria bacterium]|nr:hypothetical protein [Acidobacteriota bacterium]